MDGKYRTVRGQIVLAVHPSSVLYAEKHPKYVVFNEVVLTSQNFMRDITEIEPEWLEELAPHFYTYKPVMQGQRLDRVQIDAKRTRLMEEGGAAAAGAEDGDGGGEDD